MAAFGFLPQFFCLRMVLCYSIAGSVIGTLSSGGDLKDLPDTKKSLNFLHSQVEMLSRCKISSPGHLVKLLLFLFLFYYMGKRENNKISSPMQKARYVIVETQKTISMDTLSFIIKPQFLAITDLFVKMLVHK